MRESLRITNIYKIREIKSVIKLLENTYGLEECPTMDRLKKLIKTIDLTENNQKEFDNIICNIYSVFLKETN